MKVLVAAAAVAESTNLRIVSRNFWGHTQPCTQLRSLNCGSHQEGCRIVGVETCEQVLSFKGVEEKFSFDRFIHLYEELDRFSKLQQSLRERVTIPKGQRGYNMMCLSVLMGLPLTDALPTAIPETGVTGVAAALFTTLLALVVCLFPVILLAFYLGSSAAFQQWRMTRQRAFVVGTVSTVLILTAMVLDIAAVELLSTLLTGDLFGSDFSRVAWFLSIFSWFVFWFTLLLLTVYMFHQRKSRLREDLFTHGLTIQQIINTVGVQRTLTRIHLVGRSFKAANGAVLNPVFFTGMTAQNQRKWVIKVDDVLQATVRRALLLTPFSATTKITLLQNLSAAGLEFFESTDNILFEQLSLRALIMNCDVTPIDVHLLKQFDIEVPENRFAHWMYIPTETNNAAVRYKMIELWKKNFA